MISVLTQERLLGAALGSVLTFALIYEQRIKIHNSVSQFQSQFSPQSRSSVSNQVKEPMLEKKSGLEIAHLWNTTVDRTFGPLIESLSSRGL